jgi:elongation factor G
VIKYAIRAKSKGDEDKLGAKLHDLQDEDVALQHRARSDVEGDPARRHGAVAHRGQRRQAAPPRRRGRPPAAQDPVPRDHQGRAKNVEGKHKKQTGGKGQYGVAFIDMEPLARGGGFEFEDAIVGGAIPRQFIPAVEKGIRTRMARGVVAGYPVTDVKVTLFDGKYHDVDSDSRSFEMAGSKGFFAAFKLCKPTLLEPIMEMEIACPDDNMGDIMGDINSRRGRVLGMESTGKSQVIKAHVPMSETLKYAADLRSMTGGRGSFAVKFSHYDELPGPPG